MDNDQEKIASGEHGQPAACGTSPGPGCSLFLVLCDGKPYAAYPREVQAKVYASGFSGKNIMRIVEGKFTENPRADRSAHLVRGTVEPVVGSLNQEGAK